MAAAMETINSQRTFTRACGYPYRANKARETSPVPLAPSEVHRILLTKDEATATPADTDTVYPFPTARADEAAI